MSDISTNIHTKMRPRTLSELSETLPNHVNKFISMNASEHSILIHGPKGCGKTTLAYAMARYIFTNDADQDIDLNENMSFVEINAGTQSGVSDTRDLIEEMLQPSIMDEKKIVLIDECHNLSDKAQSSLAKPLENPPEYLYIILCTLHPDKLRDDIRERPSNYAIYNPTESMLVDYMKNSMPKLIEWSEHSTGSMPIHTEVQDEILLQITRGIDRTFRSAISALYDYIYTGVLPSGNSSDDESTMYEKYNMLINPNENWQHTLNNLLKGVKSVETFRIEIVRYTHAVYMRMIRSGNGNISTLLRQQQIIKELKELPPPGVAEADIIHRLTGLLVSNQRK